MRARLDKDEIGVALLLGQMGVSNFKEGNFAAAIEAHQEALAIWQKRDVPNTVAWVLGQIAQNFRGALQFDDALRYSKRAIILWQKQGARDRVASLWGEVGENLRKIGRHTDAIDAYIRAQSIWQELGDDVSQAWVLGGIGLTHRESGHFREAIQWHQQAIKLFKKHRFKEFSIALNHSWIAASYRQLKEFHAAIENDEAALSLWRQIKDERHEIKTLASLSLSCVHAEDFDRAFAMSEAAFEQARGANYQAQIIWNAGQLAYLHVHAGDLDRVWFYLDEQPVQDMARLRERVLTQIGAALSLVNRLSGRSTAFERGRLLLEGLRARSSAGRFNESATYLLSGLLDTAEAIPLLRDLTDESARGANGLSQHRRQAIELASDFLHVDRDEHLLEEADPDVRDAVRAIIATLGQREDRQ